MLPVYTAVLSREEFGTSDLISSTVSLLAPVLTIAISEACMRFALDKSRDTRQVFSVGIKTLLIGSLFFVLLGPVLKKLPGINGYYVLFAFLFVTTIINSFLNYFGRGIQKVKIVGIGGIVSAFTAVGCNLLFLLVFKWGVKGYLLSMIFAHVAASVTLFVGGKMGRYLTWDSPRPLVKEMTTYSLPLVPNKLSWWVTHMSNRYVLNHFCGVADVGIYSAASRMPAIIDTFRGIFIEAWQLSMIAEYEKKDSDAFFNSIFKAYTVFMLLITSGLILFSKLLGTVLYAKEFFSAWQYAPLLLLSVFFGSMVSFYSPIYLAHKKTNRLFVFTAVGAVLTIVFNFILVPLISISGAAVASVISYFCIYFSMSLDAQKYINLTSDTIIFKLSYIILTAQAFLISFDIIAPFGFFSVGLFMAIVALNFRVIENMIQLLFGVVVKRRR